MLGQFAGAYRSGIGPDRAAQKKKNQNSDEREAFINEETVGFHIWPIWSCILNRLFSNYHGTDSSVWILSPEIWAACNDIRAFFMNPGEPQISICPCWLLADFTISEKSADLP